jgi:SAM-dependent methyltransferase
MTDFTDRIHTEKQIDGFTAIDGTVRFYGFVKAILLKTGARDILDFGAGRGGALVDDRSCYRRHMRDLRTFGARVTSADVDQAVLSHPASDAQVVIKPHEPLPFAAESFDVIVSDMTFEHIDNAPFVAAELVRVLRPGGFICARTPNRLGYVRLMSGIVPERLQRRVVALAQPRRKAEDVFPTVYRMNSPWQVRRLFPGCNVHYYYDVAEPAYYFCNRFLYRAFLLAHTFLPSSLATTICVFIAKPAGSPPDPGHALRP